MLDPSDKMGWFKGWAVERKEDGTMLGSELSHMLISLGERLDETQANEVLADCLDPEDEDGFVNYAPFLARICDKPVPGEDGNPPFSLVFSWYLPSLLACFNYLSLHFLFCLALSLPNSLTHSLT
uniref:Myosin light chain alkali n=1 Tax=Cacopsylla melanoneura TaxID=428564 RepID=A0A8D9EBH8_9HEMI